jgi:hypothetical protein
MSSWALGAVSKLGGGALTPGLCVCSAVTESLGVEGGFKESESFCSSVIRSSGRGRTEVGVSVEGQRSGERAPGGVELPEEEPGEEEGL